MTQSEDSETHPTNEKLADGFADRARGANSDSSQDRFLGWIRKEAVESFELSDRNLDFVTTRVQDAQRDFINEVYSYPTAIAVRDRESWAALGRRYGVDGTTVQRWFTGSEARLRNMAVSFVAEDAIFPRGRQVAVNSYAFAFIVLLEAVNQHVAVEASAIFEGLTKQLSMWALEAEDAFAAQDSHERGPDEGGCNENSMSFGTIPLFTIDQELCEEAVVLYLVMRTPEWWMAIRSKRQSSEETAADLISGKANDLFPSGTRWDAQGIKDLIEKYADVWIAMEEALPYEWF